LTADVTGIEMSVRDQRVGTSHSDRVTWGFFHEPFVETNLYTSDGIKIRMDTFCQKSDELGGLEEILL